MKGRVWKIGSRGSPLALWQAHRVRDLLRRADAGCDVEIEVIKTSGDRIQDRSLQEVGGKGLFVKEIQAALIQDRVDLAVHSLKDYPAENPPELLLACIPEREDRRDALVLTEGREEGDLAGDARVGTGSLRRHYQAALLHPSWRILGLRGNVETRLKKADSGMLDAVILAAAGLKRLGHEGRIRRIFSCEEMVPAVGQGALALECRKEDWRLREILGGLEEGTARAEVDAERHFLSAIGASCTTPMGFTALTDHGVVTLLGFLSSIDGKRHMSGSLSGPAGDSLLLVDNLLQKFLDEGAGDLLDRRIG
jgi:hydroxymethylbilane synthase